MSYWVNLSAKNLNCRVNWTTFTRVTISGRKSRSWRISGQTFSRNSTKKLIKRRKLPIIWIMRGRDTPRDIAITNNWWRAALREKNCWARNRTRLKIRMRCKRNLFATRHMMLTIKTRINSFWIFFHLKTVLKSTDTELQASTGVMKSMKRFWKI